jgi:hypothetical protein
MMPRAGDIDDLRTRSSVPKDLDDGDIMRHGVDGGVEHGLVVAFDLITGAVGIEPRLVTEVERPCVGVGNDRHHSEPTVVRLSHLNGLGQCAVSV